MVKVLKLTEDLFNTFLNSPGQEGNRKMLNDENVKHIVHGQKHSYAFINDDGKIIACVGVLEFWPGRGEGWAMMNYSAARRDFFHVFKIVKRFLNAGVMKRVEALLDLRSSRDKKWIEMLGFKLEAPCLAQYREGQDYALYSFISGV